MQEIKTLIKPTIDDTKTMWESFEMWNRKLIWSDKEIKKYINAIDDLWLEWQKKLIAQQDWKVIPFPKMTDVEKRIWGLYAPHKAKLNEFKESIIPHEVLWLIALCKAQDYFWHIEIWSETREDIDPIIVWFNIPKDADWNDKSSYYREPYLVCRWWHSLRPFEEIVDVVRKSLTHKLRSKVDKAKVEIELYDKWLDSYINDFLSGNTYSALNTIYFN